MNLAAVLSDADIERLEDAAETLLAEVGFRVMHRGLLTALAKAGANVDEPNGTVRLPSALLHELIRTVPASYTIRWGGGEAVIGGDHQHCNAIVTDPWIIDYETRRPRRPCLEDVRRHSIIAQRLERVVSTGRMDFPVTDIADATSSLRALETHLLHYAKHYAVYVTSLESFDQWLDIAAIIRDGNGLDPGDFMSAAIAVLSPLTLTEMNGDLLERTCAHGMAVIPTICPMAGTTSPYTLAATLVQGHAENLFVAALTQIVRPGNPFLYAFGPSVTDLRSGRDRYYTLDKVLWKAASVQLARACAFPVAAECGGSMTYRYDQQSGAEGMLFMLAAQASNANLLCGIGSCHNAIGMSGEMMIVQTEWLAAAEFLGRGIPIHDSRLGLDSLRNAGPGGHFLTDDLTLDGMHEGEFFSSALLDLVGGEDSPSLLDRAHDEVEALVADAESPLPGDVQENLRRYFHDEYDRLLR
ncbi:MAG TPA: trimethylamine methyltransferase family protein [Candidatus Hydrogenedentes bacterium]|nr:trimethylamine methyltransferase family protein [Candidatus Hydrogenedentota bacterium]HPG67161.1 trimethylamine methyltransferase family protein [Candidatus Hydrogenedentota bacterium]